MLIYYITVPIIRTSLINAINLVSPNIYFSELIFVLKFLNRIYNFVNFSSVGYKTDGLTRIYKIEAFVIWIITGCKGFGYSFYMVRQCENRLKSVYRDLFIQL